MGCRRVSRSQVDCGTDVYVCMCACVCVNLVRFSCPPTHYLSSREQTVRGEEGDCLRVRSNDLASISIARDRRFPRLSAEEYNRKTIGEQHKHRSEHPRKVWSIRSVVSIFVDSAFRFCCLLAFTPGTDNRTDTVAGAVIAVAGGIGCPGCEAVELSWLVAALPDANRDAYI